MENFAAYTMLALLVVQAVVFFVSVAYRLSLKQGGHPSAEYKSTLWGAIGFLLFCANGQLAAHFLPEQFLKTFLVAVVFGVLGLLMLWLGFYQRAQYRKNAGSKTPAE